MYTKSSITKDYINAYNFGQREEAARAMALAIVMTAPTSSTSVAEMEVKAMATAFMVPATAMAFAKNCWMDAMAMGHASGCAADAWWEAQIARCAARVTRRRWNHDAHRVACDYMASAKELIKSAYKAMCA